MKIKFIKEYRAIPLSGGFDNDWGVKKDEVKDVHDENGQWFIDNGFAEEVKEPDGWEPEYGKKYYYIDGSGCITTSNWAHTGFDAWRHDIGNVFKTYDAANHYREYLEAVEAVRHDEGFMKMRRNTGYGVYRSCNKNAITDQSDMPIAAGEFYFDTYEHAKASIEMHRDEWQTILNYDWSKE